MLATMERPQAKYVDVGGEVAYQVVGQGPPDLIWVPGSGHVDMVWEDPVFVTFLERLASFSRLILFDRRGTGASDAVPDTAMPTWEEWAEDVGAVLDAAGSERTVVFAESDGGPTGLLFTAMQPVRVSGLILANTSARRLGADDYPIGVAPESVDDRIEMIRAAWGTPGVVPAVFPSRASDPEFVQWVARLMRAIATPRNVAAQIRYIVESLDARDALPLIKMPTLVLHSKDNVVYSTERAASMGDQAWHSLLDAHDRTVQGHLRRFRGNEIKTTGDGFLASFDGPARAIRCALAISESTRWLGIDLHLGLHTGECEVRGEELGGLAVHIAARIGSVAGPGEVRSHPPLRIWWPGRGSTLWTGETTNSKGCRGPGSSTRQCRDRRP